MRIIIGDKTKEYLSLLGLSYPFSFEQLKIAFRLFLFKHHPDKGGSNEKTVLGIEAYKNLRNLSQGVEKNEPIIDDPFKDDLFALTEECPECKGKKGRYVNDEVSICKDCYKQISINDYAFIWPWFEQSKGCGYTIKKCPICLGNGITKRGNICPACNGSGFSKIRCKTCKGEGIVTIKSHFQHCSKCKGLGKIELNPWNPVIPKGAVL